MDVTIELAARLVGPHFVRLQHGDDADSWLYTMSAHDVVSAFDQYRDVEIERLRDCRLCANFTMQSGGCVSVLRCVGGDRFKGTSPRRYWEDRPPKVTPF